jgi:hypothetical protein
MKKIFSFLGIIIIVFAGVTGGLLYNKEYIPDNAKVYVIEEQRIWIPNAKWVDEIFQEQSTKDLNAKRSYDNKIESTYLEVKSGKHKGYELPESWGKGDGKAKIVWGREQSLLRSWILPSKKRWNEDGSWNW